MNSDQDGPRQRLELVLARLRSYGSRVRCVRDGRYRAQCPAHDDRNPSLTVSLKSDRVLLHCFGGCSTQRVVSELGLQLRDLYPVAPIQRQSPSRIVAVYPYENLDGDCEAEKVRLEPKRFAWRRPSQTAGHKPRWGLDGLKPSLYRLPSLIEARQVLIVEGEKAVDRLIAEGFVATCPPYGASAWRPSDAETLWRVGACELVIIADNDDAGRKHAHRITSTCAGYRPPSDTWPDALPDDPEMAPLHVKLLSLDGLGPGGDVWDWFEAGHSSRELQALIEVTPYWTPEEAARAKQERVRQLGRERQRRWREKQRATPKASDTESGNSMALSVQALPARNAVCTSTSP